MIINSEGQRTMTAPNAPLNKEGFSKALMHKQAKQMDEKQIEMSVSILDINSLSS